MATQNLSAWKSNTLNLNNLRKQLSAFLDDTAYIYTLTSLTRDASGIIQQNGSAPNVEDGIVTLCTCKHYMRQGNKGKWKGVWIIGLTPIVKNKGFDGEKNYVFYITRVEKEFTNHKEFYDYLHLNHPNAIIPKNGSRNELGDIFEPKTGIVIDGVTELNPNSYIDASKIHSHGTAWIHDVSLNPLSASPVSTPLLLGEINNSFVWQKPTIIWKGTKSVRRKKLTLGGAFALMI